MKVTIQKNNEAEESAEIFAIGVCLGLETKQGMIRIALSPSQWELLSKSAADRWERAMSLPALAWISVKNMKPSERTAYFEIYARFLKDAPLYPYAIRVGSRTLFGKDTHDLREQFDKLMRYGMKWKGKRAPA